MNLPFSLLLPPVYSVATYPPGALYGPRRLLNWEFVYLLQGDAVYFADKQEVSAPEGAVVLCRPGATDGFRWDTRKRTRHAYFHFEVAGHFPASWPAPQTWPFVRLSEPGDLLQALWTHLLSWSGRGDPSLTPLLAHSLLTAFVTGEYTHGNIAAKTLPQPIADTLAFIAERLDNAPTTPLTLPALAAAACVSPEYLCRLFTLHTGKTPMETLRLARLDRAATLLTRTNYTIAEIAHLTGFESPFHFSRRFKQTYGHSPRSLRQSL